MKNNEYTYKQDRDKRKTKTDTKKVESMVCQYHYSISIYINSFNFITVFFKTHLLEKFANCVLNFLKFKIYF